MQSPEEAKLTALAAVAKELYGDLVQPAAQTAGEIVNVPFRLIRVALSPVTGSVYAAERYLEIAEKYLDRYFDGRLEDISVPPPNVAIPAMRALVSAGTIPELRKMYLRLLATSMDSKKEGVAHPAYVDIVSQMTPDEARILENYEQAWEIDSWQVEVNRHLYNEGRGYYETEPIYKRLTLVHKDVQCHFPDSVPKYLDNLARLRLVYETKKRAFQIKDIQSLSDPPVDTRHPDGIQRPFGGHRFSEVHQQYPMLADHIREFSDSSEYLQIWHSNLRLTSFGSDFFAACLDKTPALKPPYVSESVLAEDAL